MRVRDWAAPAGGKTVENAAVPLAAAEGFRETQWSGCVTAGAAWDSFQPPEFGTGGIPQGLSEVAGPPPSGHVKEPAQVVGIYAIDSEVPAGALDRHDHPAHVPHWVGFLAEGHEVYPTPFGEELWGHSRPLPISGAIGRFWGQVGR